MRASSLATKPGRKYTDIGKKYREKLTQKWKFSSNVFLLFSSVGEIYTSYTVMEQQVNTDIYNNQFSSQSTARFVWKLFQEVSSKTSL